MRNIFLLVLLVFSLLLLSGCAQTQQEAVQENDAATVEIREADYEASDFDVANDLLLAYSNREDYEGYYEFSNQLKGEFPDYVGRLYYWEVHVAGLLEEDVEKAAAIAEEALLLEDGFEMSRGSAEQYYISVLQLLGQIYHSVGDLDSRVANELRKMEYYSDTDDQLRAFLDAKIMEANNGSTYYGMSYGGDCSFEKPCLFEGGGMTIVDADEIPEEAVKMMPYLDGRSSYFVVLSEEDEALLEFTFGKDWMELF